MQTRPTCPVKNQQTAEWASELAHRLPRRSPRLRLRPGARPSTRLLGRGWQSAAQSHAGHARHALWAAGATDKCDARSGRSVASAPLSARLPQPAEGRRARTAAPAPTPVAAGLVAEVDPSTRAASVAQDATTTARLGPAATPRPGFTRSLLVWRQDGAPTSVGGSISDLTPQKPLLSASPKSPQSERASAQEAVALASEPSIKAAALAPASAVSTRAGTRGHARRACPGHGWTRSVPQLAELVHTRQMASTSFPHSAGAPASSQPKVKPVSTAADSSWRCCAASS